MPSEKLEKKTLQFREGDWEKLTDHYQPLGVTTSRLIRKLVSDHVDALEPRPVPVLDLPLESTK